MVTIGCNVKTLNQKSLEEFLPKGMLNPKSAVYRAYVENVGYGCMKQLLQLNNFNDDTCRNNLVGFSLNIKFVAHYWLR